MKLKTPQASSAPAPETTALTGGCLSAEGESALAVWQLQGRDLHHLLAQVFRPSRPRSDLAGLTTVHGHLVDGEVLVDEVLVLRDGASGRCEITTHGGPTTRRAVADLLRRSGVRLVDAAGLVASEAPERPGAALRREAHELMADDFAPQALLLHIAALEGALADELHSIHTGIAAGGASAALAERLRSVVGRASFGLAMAAPPRIVLLGAPNVGKSTLANRLLGSDRSIVTAEPGTTRDLVRSPAALLGYPFELIDGAGVRATDDPVERAGIDRVREAQASAALVVLLLDAGDPAASATEGLEELAAGADVLVLNKSDLDHEAEARAEALSARFGRPVLAVSASEGRGIEQLVEALVFRSPFAGPATRDLPVPFTRRQLEGLEAALRALEEERPEGACRALERVLEGVA